MTRRRLILALTDGLRPEAITPAVMPALHALAANHTSATAARTVRPSLAARIEDALLVVVADHGGGGVIRTEHHHPHPTNERIPLVLAGPGVAREHRLEGPVSLLDVSATALWWFGVPVPRCYEGRPLLEAFAPALPVEVAAL